MTNEAPTCAVCGAYPHPEERVTFCRACVPERWLPENVAAAYYLAHKAEHNERGLTPEETRRVREALEPRTALAPTGPKEKT